MSEYLCMEENSVQSVRVGRIILFIAILFLTWQLIQNPQHWIVLDYATLAFHEGGHLLFLPFGTFMHILGGSLFQLMVPLFFTLYFFLQRQQFSSLFCLFWLGNSFINLSTYVKDAAAMALPLLGGDGAIHDWNWLLTQTNLLNFDQVIGTIIFLIGCFCIVGAIVLMIIVLFLSFSPNANTVNFDTSKK